MTDPALALQAAIRSRLVADPGVTALVAASAIVDRGRPETFPSILIGIGSTSPAGLTLDRRHVNVVLDVHVWTRESALVDVKVIAEAVREALDAADSWILDGHRLVDLTLASARFMRDPAGEFGHGVVTIEALTERLA
ncbi:DUF3168 domain-containing protein [Propylenella binzhouense]|uniref:DUF3168 domain-containing protein n=1 Tax=Propylenella binzhouense TaxID=2555902 RepID=A0A964WS04_9HYPH|nr:DUF3168 domain-containing protein [Propylenella binzhouense]MYZ46459.1 DUF3168 domain-containing protein [Propylenella binzhouense]